jgi:kynurenine formamidase
MTVRDRSGLDALAATVVRRNPQPARRVVNCAAPPVAARGPEQSGTPQGYRLHQWIDRVGETAFVNDRITLDVHGEFSATHLDASGHCWPAALIPATAALAEAFDRDGRGLDAVLPGIVGRGILFDVADIAAAGPVPLSAVLAVCDRTGITPEPGDTLYFRLGSAPTAAGSPGWYDRLPGLSIDCAQWLLDAAPAAVVSDLGLDPAPGEVAGVASPWHELLLVQARIPLVDMAALDELARACEEEGSFSFLSVIAPLALPGASGSPVSPLAIFGL